MTLVRGLPVLANGSPSGGGACHQSQSKRKGLMRQYQHLLRVEGCIALNPFDLVGSMSRVTSIYDNGKAGGIRPPTEGNDHLVS